MTTPDARRRTLLLFLLASGERLLAARAPMGALIQEAGVPEGFDAFWRRLGSVVSRRSWHGLRALCADPFSTAVDDPLPLEAALRELRDSFVSEEVFWGQLSRAIRAGYERFQNPEDTVVAPPFSKLPRSDNRTGAYVVGQRVRVRAAPNGTSETIGYVSEEHVTVRERTRSGTKVSDSGFIAISYAGGEGFVSRQYVILEGDLFMWCKERQGRWQVVAILHPD